MSLAAKHFSSSPPSSSTQKENNFMPFVVVPSPVVLWVHPQNLTANCHTPIACVEKWNTHSGILHKDNFVGVVGGWVGAFRHFRADILIRWCPLVSGWSTTSFSGLWWLRYYQEYPLGFPVDKLLLPRNHYDSGEDGAIFLVYKIHSIWGGFCHTCYIEKISLKKLKQSLSHKRYLHLVWVV